MTMDQFKSNLIIQGFTPSQSKKRYILGYLRVYCIENTVDVMLRSTEIAYNKKPKDALPFIINILKQ